MSVNHFLQAIIGHYSYTSIAASILNVQGENMTLRAFAKASHPTTTLISV